MAKYLLTAIFLGLLITLFYYPTPPLILEEEQPVINNTPPASEIIVDEVEPSFLSSPTEQIEEDGSSSHAVATLILK